jgi:hypothetical protein
MTIELEDLAIEVTRKKIRNLRISIHPPAGEVRLSAPMRTSLAEIREFAASRLGWIKKHREKLRVQKTESRLDYVTGERHLVWGHSHTLQIEEMQVPPSVELLEDVILLRVRPGSDRERRGTLVTAWYRRQVEAALPPLIKAWEPRMSVEVKGFSMRQMKTRWGSCNTRDGSIRLNTELAKKPRECLEYVLVHEMVHLIEASHNARFKALMDRFLPPWRETRRLLNRFNPGMGRGSTDEID